MDKRRIYVTDGPGLVLSVRNDTDTWQDCNYASVTAPVLCRVDVTIDGELIECVHVGPGASHSWWTQAGGKLLDHNGLDAGQTLEVHATGAVAFRIDWFG